MGSKDLDELLEQLLRKEFLKYTDCEVSTYIDKVSEKVKEAV